MSEQSCVFPSFTLNMSDVVFDKSFGSEFELIDPGPGAQMGDVLFGVVPYLENNEYSVDGQTLIERAKIKNGFLGQKDGEEIVKRQNKIPIEIRALYYIPLPATIYKHKPTGNLFFPRLHCSDNGWHLDLTCIKSGFFGTAGRLLTPLHICRVKVV